MGTQVSVLKNSSRYFTQSLVLCKWIVNIKRPFLGSALCSACLISGNCCTIQLINQRCFCPLSSEEVINSDGCTELCKDQTKQTCPAMHFLILVYPVVSTGFEISWGWDFGVYTSLHLRIPQSSTGAPLLSPWGQQGGDRDVTQGQAASLARALLISQPSLHKGLETKPTQECTSARKLEMTVN